MIAHLRSQPDVTRTISLLFVFCVIHGNLDKECIILFEFSPADREVKYSTICFNNVCHGLF